MKILTKLAVLLSAILIGTIGFAQKKNVPGFYIAAQGDTIRGSFPIDT
jgi:hypothetical protein